MAARDSERYYWLKLHKDFFKRHDISIVEDMPNGKDYVLFYLKLMLESVDHEGALRFSDTIPYSETMLASVTRTNVDIVRSALKIFIELGMVEVFDDKTLFLRQVAELLDSETYQAKRKREMKQDLPQIGSGVKFTPPEVKNTQEIDIDTDIETDTESEEEIEKEKGTLSDESVCHTQVQQCRPQDVQDVVDAWNSLGVQVLRKVPPSTTKTGQMLRTRIREYGIGSVLEAVEMVRASDFLMGRTNADWLITFDWFVRPNNFQKVVNGNYNKRAKKQPETKKAREMQSNYDMMKRWAESHAENES